MRKCKIIKADNNKLKIGNSYLYDIITEQKDYTGKSIFLAFPYHIYNEQEELLEVLNKTEFLDICIDIQKNRKLKLQKIYDKNTK